METIRGYLPGEYVMPRGRGLGPSANGRCLGGGCAEEVGAGGRFCDGCQEALDRVKVALAGDGEGGDVKELHRRQGTKFLCSPVEERERAKEAKLARSRKRARRRHLGSTARPKRAAA